MLEDHSHLAQSLGRLGAAYRPVVLPKRKIRALTGDYFVGGGEVAEVGKTYTVDADLARAMVRFGRAEYVE